MRWPAQPRADVQRLALLVERIAANRNLRRDATRLQSAPGVGPVIAASLPARLPELGRLNRFASNLNHLKLPEIEDFDASCET